MSRTTNTPATNTNDPDRLISPAELAKRWSISRAYVYALMERGLPSLQLGRARRIRVSEADEWLATQQKTWPE